MLQGSNKNSKMCGWKETLFSYQLVYDSEADQVYSCSALGQIQNTGYFSVFNIIPSLIH